MIGYLLVAGALYIFFRRKGTGDYYAPLGLKSTAALTDGGATSKNMAALGYSRLSGRQLLNEMQKVGAVGQRKI